MSKVRYPTIQLQLPRGRLINGSMTEIVTTDHKRQPIPPEKHHRWIAIAIDKNAPGINDLLNAVIGHTWNLYSTVAGSQAVMTELGKLLAAENFSWKIDDGDTHPLTSKWEGAKGCWVFSIKRNIKMGPIKTYDGLNVQLDPACFRLGDFVDGFIDVTINGETDTRVAGCYINPALVRWLESGPVINKGADAATLFKGQTYGQGYRPPEGGPMPSHVPGQAGSAPGTYNNAPPPPTTTRTPPPPPVTHAAPPPPEDDETWNRRHTGNHAPGYRYNPATNAWDVATAQSAPSYGNASTNGHAGHGSVGNAHASVQGAPAYGQQQVAHSGAHGSPAGTAYPGNQYSPHNPPPGVQQQNYAGGPPRM